MSATNNHIFFYLEALWLPTHIHAQYFSAVLLTCLMEEMAQSLPRANFSFKLVKLEPEGANRKHETIQVFYCHV